MAGTMHIGKLASRSGRSIHTIRWYETQRLIPGVRRDAGGRRIYNELHVGWLDLMDRLRRTGMSIRQMREYTVLVMRGDATLKERREMLRAHRRRVEEMMEDLQLSLDLIDDKIEFYGQWLAAGRRPAKLPQMPPRRRSRASS